MNDRIIIEDPKSLMVGELVAEVLQCLQDSTVDVARMTPYGDLNEFLRQITYLQARLEKMGTYADAMEELARRGLVLTALS